MKMQGADAVVVQGSLASKTTADLALRHRLPAGSSPRSFADLEVFFRTAPTVRTLSGEARPSR